MVYEVYFFHRKLKIILISIYKINTEQSVINVAAKAEWNMKKE